jgi:hypothetical protein
LDPELKKDPTTDEGACDSHDEIADDSKPVATHDLVGQPSSNEADHQYDQQTFSRHVHLRILRFMRMPDKSTPVSGNASPIIGDGLAAKGTFACREERDNK